MAKQATALGIKVKRVTVVADEIAEIATAIQQTLERKPHFALTTGGLGPTFDDKTLQGIAEALNRKLTVNAKALKMVKEKYEAYAKEKGAAETVELTRSRIKMATLPEIVAPLLRQASGRTGFYEKSIYVDEVMESSLAPLIDKAMQDNPDVYVKSHPKGEENKPHIEVHLSTTAEDAERAEEKLQQTAMQLSDGVRKIGGKIVVFE
jgi:nicotinamide-nucleotide amidase